MLRGEPMGVHARRMCSANRAINPTSDQAVLGEVCDETAMIGVTPKSQLREFELRHHKDDQIDRVIAMFDNLHATTGLLSDEYSAL